MDVVAPFRRTTKGAADVMDDSEDVASFQSPPPPRVNLLYRARLSRCAIRVRLGRTAFGFARPDSSSEAGLSRYRRWSSHAAQPTSEPTTTTTRIQPTAHPSQRLQSSVQF